MKQVHHVPKCLRVPVMAPVGGADGLVSSEPGATTTTAETGGGGEVGTGTATGTAGGGAPKGSLKESGNAVVQGPSQGALQAIRAMHKNKGSGPGQGQGQGQGQGKNQGTGKTQGAGSGSGHQTNTTTTVNGHGHGHGHNNDLEGKGEVELKPLSEMKIIGIRTPQMTQGNVTNPHPLLPSTPTLLPPRSRFHPTQPYPSKPLQAPSNHLPPNNPSLHTITLLHPSGDCR